MANGLTSICRLQKEKTDVLQSCRAPDDSESSRLTFSAFDQQHFGDIFGMSPQRERRFMKFSTASSIAVSA